MDIGSHGRSRSSSGFSRSQLKRCERGGVKNLNSTHAGGEARLGPGVRRAAPKEGPPGPAAFWPVSRCGCQKKKRLVVRLDQALARFEAIGAGESPEQGRY
jgi:hypothetical protein